MHAETLSSEVDLELRVLGLGLLPPVKYQGSPFVVPTWPRLGLTFVLLSFISFRVL